MPTKTSKPSAKKTAKPAAKKTSVSATPVESASVTPRKSLSKLKVGILVGVVIIAVLLYVFRGFFIAAIVNGQVITRMSIDQQLEKQFGKKTLESLITKNLILQEMQKNNISVTDKEVNDEIKKIEDTLKKQQRTLSEALDQQGLTRSDLMDQLKIQKMIEKYFAKDSQVSDKEVDTYIEENKDSLPQSEDKNTLRDSVRTQLKQQKLSGKFQAWLANLQAKAKIQYFVNF